MGALEDRIYNKLQARLRKRNEEQVMVRLPEKRRRVIDLYRRCKLEFDNCRFGCKDETSFIQIRCVGRFMLDVKEAGSFLELLSLCDYLSVEARPCGFIIDMRYSLTAWVEKKE